MKRVLRAAERVAKARLPRRIHVLCVGAPKTGTTSLAQMFRGYRAAHEAEASRYMETLVSHWPVSPSDEHVRDYLQARDRRFRLEVDSAHMHGMACHQLVELFPEAKFVLTVRDPVSWLRSIASHHALPSRDIWRRYQDVRFGGHELPAEEETVGLRYSVRGYLSYWRLHNQTVLDAVPDRQLLTLDVADIPSAGDSLARFTGAKPRRMAQEQVHSNKAQGAGSIDLSSLPVGYVDSLADEICGDVLADLRS